MFFYVYILESLKDNKRYIGYTQNLPKRIEEHKKGYSSATKHRLPMKLIYFEACLDESDARRREIYLKSTRGLKFLVKRIKSYYSKKSNL